MATYRDAPLFLAPAVPRRLVPRPESRRWVEVSLCTFLALGLLSLLLFVGVEEVALRSGTDSVGTVTSCWESKDSKTRSVSHKVRYEYVVDGLSHHDTGIDPNGESPGQRLAIGQHVHVRSIGVSEWRHAAMVVNPEAVGSSFALFVMLFSAVLIVLLLWWSWGRFLRTRRLYRWGALSAGVIVARREATGTSLWRVDYTFTPPGGVQQEGSAQLSSNELFAAVAVGESVTVLHPPHRPSPSLVYEYGDYQWADGAPSSTIASVTRSRRLQKGVKWTEATQSAASAASAWPAGSPRSSRCSSTVSRCCGDRRPRGWCAGLS